MRTCLTGTEEVLQSHHSHNAPTPQQGIRHSQFAICIGGDLMNKKLLTWLSLALTLLVASLAVWCTHRQNCKVTRDGDQSREYRMCTDKKRYRFGETVHVSFTITNISDHPLEFGDGSGPAMDICDLWKMCWSSGRELTDEQKHFVLQPGESHTLGWNWSPSQVATERIATSPGGGAVPVDLRGKLNRGGTMSGPAVYFRYGRP